MFKLLACYWLLTSSRENDAVWAFVTFQWLRFQGDQDSSSSGLSLRSLSSKSLISETDLNVILREDVFSLSRLTHQSYRNRNDFLLLILETPCESMAKRGK